MAKSSSVQVLANTRRMSCVYVSIIMRNEILTIRTALKINFMKSVICNYKNEYKSRYMYNMR
jgi:hypothetical protein